MDRLFLTPRCRKNSTKRRKPTSEPHRGRSCVCLRVNGQGNHSQQVMLLREPKVFNFIISLNTYTCIFFLFFFSLFLKKRGEKLRQSEGGRKKWGGGEMFTEYSFVKFILYSTSSSQEGPCIFVLHASLLRHPPEAVCCNILLGAVTATLSPGFAALSSCCKDGKS